MMIVFIKRKSRNAIYNLIGKQRYNEYTRMYSKYQTNFLKVGYKQNLKMNITYNKYKRKTNIKHLKI